MFGGERMGRWLIAPQHHNVGIDPISGVVKQVEDERWRRAFPNSKYNKLLGAPKKFRSYEDMVRERLEAQKKCT